MPLKFFLKLYARLIGLTSLILLFCVGLYLGINSVREQHWQERFAGPLMRWIALTPDAARQYQWLASVYDLQVLPLQQLALSDITMERLLYGQVLTQRTSTGERILVLDGSGKLIRLGVSELYRDVSEALALIVRWHLSAIPVQSRKQAMEPLSASLGVSLAEIRNPEQVPDSDVLGLVAERDIAFYQLSREGRAHVLVRLEDGSLVDLTLPAPFEPWAWPLLLLLFVVGGSVLALALYLAMREVDGNLRAVESVAIRIARGEMGARVETNSSRLVSRLAAAFNGMAEHIQRLVGVQREMIHAVSHELRTPVARIRFGVQMIEGTTDPGMLQKQLDGIDGDIQELDELIDEILTYARLEQGGPVFALQECSVTDIVRQVVSEQQLIRTEHVIEAEIDAESETWAFSDVEPRYIHRALQNLVGNGARYAATRVRVLCQLDEDNCRIDVEDDGPGVPREDWEKVFTAFARLDDSRTRTSGGYGLGLSIVRRILYWHGGQAFVSRSEDLGGAKFSLVWPRKKPIEPSI